MSKKQPTSGLHHVVSPDGNVGPLLRHETFTPHVKGNGEFGGDSAGFVRAIDSTGDRTKASALGRKLGR